MKLREKMGFKRAAVPPACRSARRWTPAEIGRLVAAIFADLCRVRAAGPYINGAGERARNPPPDTTEATLYEVLIAALAKRDDEHVGLEATIAGQERSFESGEAPTIRALRKDEKLGSDPAARERTWSHAALARASPACWRGAAISSPTAVSCGGGSARPAI